MIFATSKVYILIDAQSRIVRCEGEYSLPADLTGWILVEEGPPCDRLNLAQSHYLPKGLRSPSGAHLYKFIDGAVVERTAQEIAEDSAPPTTPANLESRVDNLERTVDTMLTGGAV